MHIEPTQKALSAFFAAPPEGPVVMLNLLRFREIADYDGHPEVAPESPISGAHAYARYGKHTLPFLKRLGAEVVFRGDAADFLIGPADERWDLAILVRYPTGQAFLEMLKDADYRAGTGHRDAALEDSRLLPINPA